MTAKEMFEELGFVRKDHKQSIEYTNGYLGFEFWTTLKNVEVWEDARFISVETHKAIHQQMLELGWL